MKCPHCNIDMGTTYEPYEYRCGKCGYWFDTYTGKEVTFAPPADEEDYDPLGIEYGMWANTQLGLDDDPDDEWGDYS